MSTTTTQYVDIAGIGFGPSNLATAVALAEAGIVNFVFLEKKSSFSWHPGMMLKESNLQNSFLKDLITLHNPKSHFTFLNYLSQHGRIEDFVNRRCFFPSREEITDYMRWAALFFAKQVWYNTAALQIRPTTDGRIEIECQHAITKNIARLSCKFLILGMGAAPFIPPDLFFPCRATHTAEISHWLSEQRFARDTEASFTVLGGGQSSAEVVYHLLEGYPKSQIHVVSRRFIYKSLEESALINNLFSVNGMNWFSNIISSAQKKIFQDLYEANFSAVDNSLISKIYDILYEERRNERNRVHFFPYCEVVHTRNENDQFYFAIQDYATGKSFEISSNYLIYATGYRYTNVISLLEPFQPFLQLNAEGLPLRNDDYSLKFSPHTDFHIFAHATGDMKFGFTEGGMTNLAARANRITTAIQLAQRIPV